jgi:hypothetical protein
MPQLPLITPMLTTACGQPFGGADWLFEIKHDGFQALAYVDGHCRLISRNGYRFSGFGGLEQSLAQTLRGHTIILDGEKHGTACRLSSGAKIDQPLTIEADNLGLEGGNGSTWIHQHLKRYRSSICSSPKAG